MSRCEGKENKKGKKKMNTKYNVGDNVTTPDFSGVCIITQVLGISKISGEMLYVVKNEMCSELVEKESVIFKTNGTYKRFSERKK